MSRALLAAACVLLASCASTFTDTSKLPCRVTHRMEKNKLIVTATVTNKSKSTVTFVRHPDFYSLSVLSADRSKAKAVGPLAGLIVHFERAVDENLVRVRPGEQAVFEQRYIIHRKPGGTVELEGVPCTMRVWDSHVRATFHYGIYPDYLPKHAWALGKNYVMTELKAEEVFPRP